ncbi:hypothetical protein SDRG_09188 [Saprolegnia diclina VS20]|uniref:Leucine-rich repeat-containing N-terminal plant-type domain-containing protein n=1 Tax=Saprolegnia diclina (strain VS20) TaxID=1156394 RepID=T0Q5Q5_SAPDV|nr:hypothetical protein SDRG_09188 [Saprolegnia diclina VS20]EQC33204.1 hypothetical protein SDRG_09188 [Saprolegnia diclina VS20]|eukprot:XP_008613327.1 hypothetical protein SDRG_09188 [Saprolegnia diclina VS20]
MHEKGGQRRLSRVSELDVIGAVCCLYAVCIASAHALLYDSVPFRLVAPATNPLATAAVLLSVAVLHLFGLYQLARSRSGLNDIISRMRSMRQLPPSRHSRSRSHMSSRSSVAPRFQDQGDDVHDWHIVRHNIAAGLAAHGCAGTRRSIRLQHLHVKMTVVTVAMTADKYFQRFLGKKGLFSQNGALYELRLLAREVVIVPIQFLRGYKLSSHVESAWVVVYGVVLAIQWLVVPPLLAWNFYSVHASGDKRDQIQAGRIRILLLLLAFDLVLGVAIPVLLLGPSVMHLVRGDVADAPTIEHVHDLSVARALVIGSVLDLVSATITLGVIYWTLQSVCAVRRRAFLKENITVAAKMPAPSTRSRRSTRFKSRMSKASVAPTTPVGSKASVSPTIYDLPAFHAFARQEARAHACRRRLFQGMLAFSTLLAAALLLVVLRAALPCKTTPHSKMTCTSFVRPWHVQPLFSQRCECKLLSAACASMDATHDSNNISDFLLSHAAQSINALSLTNCSQQHTPAIVAGVEQLPSLWYLSLIHCHEDVDTMEFNLTHLTTLVYLALHGSVFTALPLSLRELPPLVSTLDLSMTDWSQVEWPVWVPSAWGNLRHICLAACHLSSLPWPLLHLSSLITLDVSFNQMTTIPLLNGTTWPRLTQLDLGNNALVAAPLGVWSLPQLESLVLTNNALGLCPWPARYQQQLVLTGNPCCDKTTSPFC